MLAVVTIYFAAVILKIKIRLGKEGKIQCFLFGLALVSRAVLSVYDSVISLQKFGQYIFLQNRAVDFLKSRESKISRLAQSTGDILGKESSNSVQ